MTIEQVIGQAEFAAYLADLILIERAEWFDDTASFHQFLNSGYAIVMGLD